MVEVLRKSFVPLLLAAGVAALAGCSGGYHSEAATTANRETPCAVGPAAQQQPACDTKQDQGEVRALH